MNYQIKVIHPNDALDIMRQEKKFITTTLKPKHKNLMLLCGDGVKVGWIGSWGFLPSESREANGKIFATADIICSKRLSNKEIRKVCADNGITQVKVSFNGHTINLSLDDLSLKAYTWVSLLKVNVLPYYEFITKKGGEIQAEDGETQFIDNEMVKWVN